MEMRTIRMYIKVRYSDEREGRLGRANFCWIIIWWMKRERWASSFSRAMAYSVCSGMILPKGRGQGLIWKEPFGGLEGLGGGLQDLPAIAVFELSQQTLFFLGRGVGKPLDEESKTF